MSLIYIIICIVCLSVCLCVCLRHVESNLQGLKSYDHEIWNEGPLRDRKPLHSIRIFIFGRGTFLWARTPFFGLFGLFRDYDSYHLQIWNLGSLAPSSTCEIIKCFKNRFLIPGRVIIFWSDMGANPVFGLFGLFKH